MAYPPGKSAALAAAPLRLFRFALWPLAAVGVALGFGAAPNPSAAAGVPAEEKGEAGTEAFAADGLPWLPAPYPPSESIAGIEFDWKTRVTQARGSDIWPIAWAADDRQYAAFGDGSGFGVESAGDPERVKAARVSLGVARIEGDWDSYRGVNVWGGLDAENPAEFEGKGTGLIGIGGALYMFVGGPKSLTAGQTQVAVSHDLSRSWRLADWKWTMARDRIMAGNFLDGGKDNSAAFDEYVYCYFTRIENLPPGGQPRNWIHERPGRIDLARVPKDGLLNRDAYEWFHGLDGAGAPVWTKDMKARAPAFEDPNGIKVVSACYVRALEKCLLLYNPRDNRGHFALFEAPAPWGPWRRAAYLPDCQPFMPPEENARVSLFHFAPKWWSEDGREFSLVFNTGDDAWNTVRGRLLLR